MLSTDLKWGLPLGQFAVWISRNVCLARRIRLLLESVTLAGHPPDEGRELVLQLAHAEGACLRVHDNNGAKVVLLRLLPEHPGLLSHHAVELALAPLA